MESNMEIRKRTGFVKKKATKEKIQYLEDNLAVVESQRHIDAIESLGSFYNRNKKLSEGQEEYLDILVSNVRKVRGIQ